MRWLLVLAGTTICALAGASSAHAFSAPVPTAPADGASVSDDSAITFSWNGSLQGTDASQVSSFRVDVASTADVPTGGSSACSTSASCVAWSDLVTFQVTSPGANIKTLSLGAPQPGSYSWRVCVWGDDPGQPGAGLSILACSARRDFTSTQRASDPTNSDVVTETNVRTETLPERVETHTTPGQTVTTPLPDPEPQPQPRPQPPAPQPQAPTPQAQPDAPKASYNLAAAAQPSASASAVDLALSSIDFQGSDSAWGTALQGVGTLGASIAAGLRFKIPGTEIPLWPLLCLLVCIPMVIVWRRATLSMFDTPLSPPVGASGIKAAHQPADGALHTPTYSTHVPPTPRDGG